MKRFYKTTLKSLRQTGIISPSSRFLVKDMMKHIDFKPGQVFVEFGTGDGCMTSALCANMSSSSQLYSFELHPDFFAFAEAKFEHDDRVQIYNESALDFDQSHLLSKDIAIDYVISSLPLSLLKKYQVHRLLYKVNSRLTEEGKFIQYQYSLGKYRSLRRIFSDVSIDYTLRNLPPAFVYECKK